MPNQVKQAMVKEYQAMFGDAPDMVAVDINAMTVEEMQAFRNEARSQEITVFVVKTSLARLTLKDAVKENGLDQVISGPTAVIFGAEEGLPAIARLADAYGKKVGGKLAVRGGIFEKEVMTPEDVLKFKDIPDRHTLLGQILATMIAPLTGTLAAVNTLLAAPAALADALVQKPDKQQEEEGS